MTKARKLADLGNVYDDGALSNRNLIINGAMQVAQRGSTKTKTGTGTELTNLDRYAIWQNLSGVVVDLEQSTDAPESFYNSLKVTITTAATTVTSNSFVGLGQLVEAQNIHNAFWGGHSHITMSFWVKSSISGTFALNLNPCQTNSGGSSDRVLYHANYTIDATNTWEYKTVTVPLAGLNSYALLSSYNPVSKGLEVSWVLDTAVDRQAASLGWNDPAVEARNMVQSVSGGTGFYTTSGATFQITGVQLEVGDTATPFEHRSYGDELVRCQRYYYQVSRMRASANGNAGGYTTMYSVLFPTEMRTTPTITHIHVNNPFNWSTRSVENQNNRSLSVLATVDGNGYYYYNDGFKADAEL